MMLSDYYATKLGMTQVWDQSGKRVPATRLKVEELMVVDVKSVENKQLVILGIGRKRLQNAKKPLRSQLEKSGFSFAPLYLRGTYLADEGTDLRPGDTVNVSQVLTVGDVVDVQGTSKGRGFAGGMKRHGFHGGPKTHGQSDRARAVGSIGAGTTPGRVLKGKKMPGHYGVETKTVKGLTILGFNLEKQEMLVSGPVPGHINAVVRVSPTGSTREVKLTAASLTSLGVKSTSQPETTQVQSSSEDKAQPQTQPDNQPETSQPEVDEARNSSETNQATTESSNLETNQTKPEVDKA